MVRPLPPFMGFVNKTIPTAFENSMSYYDTLCVLYNYLHDEILPQINEDVEKIAELTALCNELKDYVDNYFDNLDVQDEINYKLDKMAQDGSLTNLIGAYVNPIIATQNQRIDEIEATINGVASGSPAGVYATLSDLETADPSHDKIYVVTANGNWYYYDATDSAWTAGGTYQSTGIGEGEVKVGNLESPLRAGIKANTIATLGTISSSGSYYNGNVGSTIALSAGANFSCGYITVNTGELLTFPFVCKTGNFATIPVLVFTDEDDKVIEKILTSDIRDENGQSKNYTKVIPATIKKCYFNAVTSSDQPVGYPVIITGYNYQDDRLNSQLNTTESITPNNETLTGLYTNRYWGANIGGYTTKKYAVNALDKIHVVRTIPNSDTICAGVFVDENIKPVGVLLPQGNNTTTTAVDEDAICPAGAKWLLISSQSSEVVNVSKYIFSEESTKKYSVSYDTSDGLTITNVVSQDYFKFKNFGGNNLFGFQAYKSGSTTVSTSTDMTPAPYMMEAVNNGDGDRTTLGFTGGCHSYNNSIYATSSATATQDSISVLCDGGLISTGNTANCDKIVIKVVNLIQASNTCLEDGGGRNVLKESLTYVIEDDVLSVSNIIEPLEALDIYRYYGLQLTGANNTNYRVYENEVYSQSNLSQLVKKPYAISGNNIVMKMKDCGIGNYANNNTNKAIISDNKAYYVPIRKSGETPTRFTSGDTLYFCGCYELGNNVL